MSGFSLEQISSASDQERNIWVHLLAELAEYPAVGAPRLLRTSFAGA